MGAGEEEDAIALLALAEEESASALKVRGLQGGDGEAESGSEGLAERGDGVEEGAEAEHLGGQRRRG